MNPDAYQQFTEQLRKNLEKDDRVVGLVAFGSMAQTDHQPDEWSDHDFAVIVDSGQQDDFRQHLNWLPDSENIVFSHLETTHGLKVLYRSGHLIEFAVFDNEELYLARVNSYRVLLDRRNITGDLEKIRLASRSTPRPDRYYIGQLLGHLQVGVGRYARGEKLSGHIFIKHYAVDDLLSLMEKYQPDTSRLDNLDPFRRFEFVLPDIGAELNAILLLEPPQAAEELLTLFEREFQHRLPEYPQEAVRVVLNYIRSTYLASGQTHS